MTEAAEARFWETTALHQMDPGQWDALCDGCGLCCLEKWELRRTVQYTCVACNLLDPETARCSDYDHRFERVKDCAKLTPKTLPEASKWLPDTCAYKRLHQGLDLPHWHPLITGDPESTQREGIGVAGRVVPADKASDFEQFDSVLLVVRTGR